jgi:hypothetical protein
MGRLGTSDVPSQARRAQLFLSPRTGVKLGTGFIVQRRGRDPEDVGQQALMRGLDTAFPFFVWGCPGLRSGVDQVIGHTGSLGSSPAVVPPSLLHD